MGLSNYNQNNANPNNAVQSTLLFPVDTLNAPQINKKTKETSNTIAIVLDSVELIDIAHNIKGDIYAALGNDIIKNKQDPAEADRTFRSVFDKVLDKLKSNIKGTEDEKFIGAMKVIDKILRIYRKYHQTSENDRAKAINYTYDKAKKIALDITYIRYFQSLLSRLSNHIDRNEIRLTDDFIIIKTTNKKSDGRSQDTEKASIANVTTSVKKTNTYYRSPTMTSNVDIVKDAARHAEELGYKPGEDD